MEGLRNDFDKPLRVEEIAKKFGMSPSGFHHYFKTVTDKSPIQFQRQVRLQEARRLMLGEEMDAAGAGYRVGYDGWDTSGESTRSSLETHRHGMSNGFDR